MLLGIDEEEKLKYIETHYAVENIRCKDILLWPYLRSYFFALYEEKKDKNTCIDRTKVRSIGLYFRLLRRFIAGILKTDFSLFSKKNKAILFTDSGYSFIYGGKIRDKLCENLVDEYNDIIPFLSLSKKLMPYKHFIARDFVDNFINLRYLLLRIYDKDIIGSEIVKNICKDLNVYINLSEFVRYIVKVQKFYVNLLSKMKPTKIFMTWYYEVYKIAIIDVAHRIGIPVIEFQHGTPFFFAYTCFKDIQGAAYPDYFFSFGPAYAKYISPIIYTPERIKIVGYYYLELIRQREKENKLLFDSKYLEKSRDKIIITVASQQTIDRQLLDFYSTFAENYRNLLIIFKPRVHENYHSSYRAENLIIEEELDVYVCMQNSSVVSTVYSTCGLEALSLGKPLLLIDIEGLAKSYFGSFLGETNFVRYTNRLDEAAEFISHSSEFDNEEIVQLGGKFYAQNHQALLKQALKQIG